MIGLIKIRVIPLPPSKGEMLRKIIFGILVLLIASPCDTNAQRSKGSLSIGFNHYVDNQVLKLDSANYLNALGQSFTVSNFKYYIGNIHLTRKDGKDSISTDYFLINEDEALSKKIMLSGIPPGEYTSINFIIGVDSSHNCSGAQSGALDPVKAMFWTWNTGYIFMKLEGKSSASSAIGKIFEYHIGGYKYPSNCIRIINLKFETPLIIEKGKQANTNIHVNAAELLKAPTSIDFSKLPTVTDSKNATTIADNYIDMFTLEK
ncbi:hypothetical protein BH10BAC1_BH10BAC1_01990 [soil metagenome]